MTDFKFSEKEREDIRIDMNSMILTDGEIIDRIEQIISERGEQGETESMPDEFVELLSMAQHMQNLYRNNRFALSDQEMTSIVAHLDDLRRIPSPPKTK